MRVLLLSDTHGNLLLARKALKLAGQVLLVLHAGDYHRDALRLARAERVDVRGVRGNCDLGGEGPLEDFLELGGHRVFLTHGHQFGVKGGLERLTARALAAGADIAVYGHTHVPAETVFEGVLLVNPGSVGYGRGAHPHTCALLDLGAEPVVRFLNL